MDHPPVVAPQSNPEPASADPSTTEAALRAEVAHLRQRLRFYEGFDRIIQDNISRAGELLRAAEEERTLAARELTAARQETTRSAQRQRTLLIDLAAEAQALSRRMLDAVDALPGDVTTTEPGSPAESTRTAPSDEPVDAAAVAIAAPTSGHTAGDVDAGPLATATADGPRAMTVIVHGVPDARAALSLQRHLAQLAGPGTVLAREFMGGIARFEVTGNAITFDDLRRWDGGEALRPVHLLPDVVEVAAPGAAPG